MLAASNMSRITLSKSSFSFGVSSHLVRGSLSFTSSSASIFSLFGFICVREGSFSNAVDTSADFEGGFESDSTGQERKRWCDCNCHQNFHTSRKCRKNRREANQNENQTPPQWSAIYAHLAHFLAK